MFASAEAAPIARVGGLAEAAGGLIRSLGRSPEVDLEVVLPDYGGVELADEVVSGLDVPSWVGGASVRTGVNGELGTVHLVSVPGLARPHPYVDEDGSGWPDNAARFFGFSTAVASFANTSGADVVHVNDWHTALTLAMTELPSVFTIHTLGYQGQADLSWFSQVAEWAPAQRLGRYHRGDHLNPVAGAIGLASKVVTVSPNYAREILDPEEGAGLHGVLAERGDDLVGICNGIDTELWDPLTDPALDVNYDFASIDEKSASTASLRSLAGWPDDDAPVIGMVTRIVDQKGLDLMLGAVPYLQGMNARLFVLGSGDEGLTSWARRLADEHPEHVHFVDGYDVNLARKIFAGADLFVMPSRFEPCGLAQMQAMRYGTIPVVTPVGGLVDTVIDVDDDPKAGNGIVLNSVDTVGVVDGLHRGLRSWRDRRRRKALQRRGMRADWSWDAPMREHLDLYRSVAVRDD